MTPIIVSPQNIPQFDAGQSIAEVRDPSGQLLGFFAASKNGKSHLVKVIRDLIAAMSGTDGVPLIEVYRNLQARVTDPATKAQLDQVIKNLAQRQECDTP